MPHMVVVHAQREETAVADDDPRDADLTGRTVVMREQAMLEQYRGDPTWLVFECDGGFGCKPGAGGTKVFGVYVRDGYRTYVRRRNIARFATEQEVALARAVGDQR
jgi:hypothetical protein